MDVAFSPDGKRLATASDDNTVKVWDAATGQGLLNLPAHSGAVVGVAFSPDGKRLATASYDKTAKVWDANTGQVLLTLSGHTGGVNGVAFSPDGARLATGSDDQTARVWDISLETRSPETIAALAQCKGLWRLDEGRLLPANPDPTTCPPHNKRICTGHA